jgi:hypothetical protein
MIRPDDEDLQIKTGGRTLGGWVQVHVMRGVELPIAPLRIERDFPEFAVDRPLKICRPGDPLLLVERTGAALYHPAREFL